MVAVNRNLSLGNDEFLLKQKKKTDHVQEGEQTISSCVFSKGSIDLISCNKIYTVQYTVLYISVLLFFH